MPAGEIMDAKLIAEQKPLSIIDVLTAGFEIVRKRPWTVLIPILLDTVIWFLPRLSLGALLRPAVDEQFPTTGLSPDLVDNAKQMHDAAVQVANSLNLFSVVTGLLDGVARLPSLLLYVDSGVHSPINSLAYTMQLDSEGLATFLFLPLFLLGLFLAALYIELIAQGVRPLQNEPPLAWVWRSGRLWLRLILYSFMLGMIFFISSLVLDLAEAFTPLGADLGSFVAALVTVGWLWLTIYFFFVIPALSIGNLSLFEALRRSILIFRVHFWASLGLVTLTLFLDLGLRLFVWNGLAMPGSDLGILMAIVLNAIIGTGLLAGLLVFYQDRMLYTERLIARARAARK